MNFAEAAKNKTTFTRTENGAVALNTTGSKLVDFFGTVGSLREADQSRVERLFADAYSEDPLAATKIVFYARDIREGLGERETFRILLRYMAKYHPEAVLPNIDMIGEYGRYDDWYCLIGTPAENSMWRAMRDQFMKDIDCLEKNKSVSLLGKWMKTADASSENTRKLGILTARKLGWSVYAYKRAVRALRKKIKVTEALMSAKKWDEIDYSAVPSRAMMNYRSAFAKHDAVRFREFTNKAVTGEVKINSGTLYPYDIVEKFLYYFEKDEEVLEAQWRQLPDYVEGNNAALVIADTSGSMYGRPLCTAIGLAIYFAERNSGPFKDLFMTFSAEPKYQVIKGETLRQKIDSVDSAQWDMNTDLHKAFKLVLKTATENHLSQEDIPKSLIVISDMEIDRCGNKEWSFYDKMASKFTEKGYQIPNIIFWNVDSRHDTFHADAERKGVQLVSGQSVSVFKQVLDSITLTPLEMVYKVVNSPRYDQITIKSSDD